MLPKPRVARGSQLKRQSLDGLPTSWGHMGIGGVIFYAIITGMIAGLLGFVEMLATNRFFPGAFRWGLRVFRVELALPRNAQRVPRQDLQTATSIVRFAGPDECFFRSRSDAPGSRPFTPFALRGRIRWEGPRAVVEGRLPITPLIFFLCGIIAFGGFAILSAGDLTAIFLLLAVPAACWWGIRVEIGRTRVAADEIAATLAGQAV